ncbi:unnamed protein product, partial [Mesorhabditis spiculigera]
MTSPVFSPFVMDGLTPKPGVRRKAPVAVMPRKQHKPPTMGQNEESSSSQQQSSSSYAPDQRQRAVVVKRLVVVSGTAKDDPTIRRPRQAIGTGAPLGERVPIVPHRGDQSLTKTLSLMPTSSTRRKYFSDEDLQPQFVEQDVHHEEHHYLKDDIDVVQQEEVTSDDICDPSTSYIDVIEEGHMGMEYGQLAGGHHQGMSTGRQRIQQPSQFRQLMSENQYLKDQLDVALYKNKQLEMILVDRSLRIKELVRENLQTNNKCRMLINHLGEEAVEGILNPKRPDPPSKKKKLEERNTIGAPK